MTTHRLGYRPRNWCHAIALQLIVAAATAGAQVQSAAQQLDGAWQLVSTETIGPDGARYPGRTHENFLLFSNGHYSMNWAFGPLKGDHFATRFKPTDAEKLARYSTLLVNAGRFELNKGVLTIRPLFALVPEFVGGLGEFAYSLDGATLQLVWTKILAADGTPDPNTAAGVRYVSRWQRIPK